MKKLLLGCAIALCGMPTAVSAQDFCCPVQNDCSYSGFDGFYVGGNVGAISHTAHRNDYFGALTDNSGWSTIDTNVTAGVMLGYDWQCSSNVFGLVADWNWVNTRHTLTGGTVATPDDFINSDFNWFTTIRARAGVTVCDALIYVTGGAAVARHETRWEDTGVGSDFNHTRWGWAGGFGTEFLLGCNWSAGLEFLFLNFDEKVESGLVGTTDGRFGHSDSAWLGRFTLNYRFGDLCSCF